MPILDPKRQGLEVNTNSGSYLNGPNPNGTNNVPSSANITEMVGPGDRPTEANEYIKLELFGLDNPYTIHMLKHLARVNNPDFLFSVETFASRLDLEPLKKSWALTISLWWIKGDTEVALY